MKLIIIKKNHWICGVITGLSLALVACSSQNETVPANDEPSLLVVRPHRDFGTIRIESRTEEFEIWNRGQSPLKISKVGTSCRCTKADVSEIEILPGKFTVLTATLTPTSSGKGRASIAVHSNDPVRPVFELSTQWNAVAAISAKPLNLEFGVIRPTQKLKKQIILTGSVDELADLPREERFRWDARTQLAIERETREELSGAVREVWTVALTPEEGAAETRASIHVNANNGRTLQRIPVRWTVKNTVEPTPNKLFLGVGNPGDVINKTLTLRADPGETLEVHQIESPSFLSVSKQVVDPETIKLTVSGTLPTETGLKQETIRIRYSQPQTGEIVVPVSLVVRAPNQGNNP